VTAATDEVPAVPLDISPEPIPPPSEERKKPGFFSRLNPFRSKPKPAAPDETARVVMLTPQTPSPAPVAVAPAEEKPVFPRYSYASPRPPGAGNRASAQRAMEQATKSVRAGDTKGALLDYQIAVAADPSYFDAHYNGALLALQAGELNRALQGWELALALEPGSLNARYNFALTLKQANYAYDAVRELERIIEASATDVRAHLTLANLCAQQLNEVEKARAHYLKVMELDPRNPQAPAIRFWLAAHP
jgi:tetratricopeptide (TPR) repeat protein